MSKADAIAKTALTVISKYGKTIPYTRVEPGSYDPNTSINTPVITTIDLKAVVEEWPTMRRMAMQNIATGLILVGDRIITFSASSVTARPEPGDKFDIDGDIFSIVENGVQATWFQDKAVLYTVVGRKA